MKLDRDHYTAILKQHLPEAAIPGVLDLLEEHPAIFKITRERHTKQGDFKVLRDGQLQISVNHNLNPYSFLLTLIHELAHLVTYKNHRWAKPHGSEWKYTFKMMMLPFINNEVFPNDLLPYLAQYFINPKAATGSDVQLTIALKKYDVPNGKTLLYEIKKGSIFEFRDKKFQLGDKRRTRFECTDVLSQKKYLIHQNAEVSLVE